jgi:outer membrane autotransporter protein
MFIKSAIAATAALSTTAGAALAGPYVNIETNAGWVGNDYSAAVTDVHVGYEGEAGEQTTWYVQGGPAFVSVDGEDTESEISGKAGLNFAATEKFDVYGEVSFLTDGSDADDTGYGAKLGVKFKF